MIINDLDIEWTFRIIWPFKANSPLGVDANAELTRPLASECLKAVAAKLPQSVLVRGCVKNLETLIRLTLKPLELGNSLPICEAPRSLVAVFRSRYGCLVFQFHIQALQ